MLPAVAYSISINKLSKLPAVVRLGADNRLVAGLVEESTMKQYLLSVCYPAGGSQPPATALKKIMSDVKALQSEMQSAGVWVFSGGLYASNSATVLRHQNGDIVLTDGPFIESKEQIGGITIVRVPDLDAALLWARKLAGATTTPIEVRPFMEQPG
jgi:hypothetical protein